MVTAVGGWARARARARARVISCVCVCVHTCIRDVFAIYDNIISPRLIMIIIKTILLYVSHTLMISPQWVPG